MKVVDNLIIYLTQFEPFKLDFPTERYDHECTLTFVYPCVHFYR